VRTLAAAAAAMSGGCHQIIIIVIAEHGGGGGQIIVGEGIVIRIVEKGWLHRPGPRPKNEIDASILPAGIGIHPRIDFTEHNDEISRRRNKSTRRRIDDTYV
jgi:hypothetical protein